MSLLVHDKTKQQIEAAVRAKYHALLLVGPHGSGKTTLARDVAARLLATKNLAAYPYYAEFVDGTLGIDQIRIIHEFMRRKTTGTGDIRRVCLLDGVDVMTQEAANALLKTLEEPADDTVYILTADSESAVALTIRSRTQALHILPVTEQEATVYFQKQGHASGDIVQAFRLSGGRAALMSMLLSQQDHPLVNAVHNAKQILSDKRFERLSLVDELSKDKDTTMMLLFGLERIAESLVSSAAKRGSKVELTKAHKLQARVFESQQQLAQNANTKLVLTNLFLEM